MKRKLLSILLTFCLAFSLLPTAALADGETANVASGNVAKIGNIEYATLAEAVAAVHEKTSDERSQTYTIELLRDATGSGFGVGYDKIKNGTTEGNNPVHINIEMNGHTYTVSKPTVGSSGTETNGLQLLKGSTVTFKNGTLNSVTGADSLPNGGILIQNYCNLTLENVTLDTSANSNISYVISNNFGSLTAKGNTVIKAADGKVAFDLWYGMNDKGLYDDGVSVTFGTDFTGSVTGKIEYGAANRASTMQWPEKTKLTIESGKFEVTFVDSNAKDGVALADANISITGGTFSSDVSAYVADGYILNNGTVEKLGETNAVAKVGGTYYKTLADAVAAAQNGDTITLLKDVDLGNTVTVANKTVTLNMAGKTIYNTKDLWDSKLNAWSLISVRENGNLTITGDGTLKAKADDCYALDTQEGSAKLTVENGTVIGNISAIYAFLGEVTINGGSYSIQQLNTNNVQDGYGLTINCYDQNYKEKTAKITVTGGYFAHFDPANNKAEGVGTNFVKDGYVSVTSDKSGYDYKVVKKTDTGSIVVKPAVAEPEVNVSDKISENDKLAVENAAKSVAVPTLGAAAGDKVAAMNKTDAERLVAKAEGMDNPTLYVQTALKVEPTAYNAENKTLTLDITPQYRIVASTADKADDIQLSGNSRNAQVVQDYQKLTITAPTVVTMELPTEFANANDKLSIKHIKDNGTVEYYTGIVTETSGTKTLTFTTNGFSPFTISAPAASIGETMYPTLAEAIAKAANGNTVKLEKNCTESVTVSGKSLAIDKNNHEYDFAKVTVDANSTKTENGGILTITYTAPSYSSGSSSYDPTYSVSTPSKTENGSVTVSPKNASKGDTVTVTVKPDSGYVLETLTVTDKNGNELTLKDKGNGKYTFTMPAGKVEVKATFMEDNSMLNFFYDVPNNAYFYEAVKWAVENGITTGVGNDLFAPEQPCTRAQIVTFLWRAAGSPEPKGAASGMTDVVSGSYYEKAVAWAIENGITTGTTTSTFSPDATCTRAQAVTFLARALKAKAASAAEFSDVPNDSYFADAVAWAAANGVTEGIGGGLFGSDNDCTRGQIVTFLYRAYNK